jgi:hypothetical protein
VLAAAVQTVLEADSGPVPEAASRLAFRSIGEIANKGDSGCFRGDLGGLTASFSAAG